MNARSWKMRKTTLAVLLVGFGVIAATNANADTERDAGTGIVEFKGKIVASTCTVMNLATTVPFEDLKVSDLKDKEGPVKPFSIAVEDCPDPDGKSVTITFAPSTAAVGAGKGLFPITDGAKTAKGVGIQLKYKGGNVSPDEAIKLDGVGPATTELAFEAHYAKTGSFNDVKAGQADAIATFEIKYQ